MDRPDKNLTEAAVLKKSWPVGVYQHYRTGEYFYFTGFSRHSETLELLAHYTHCDHSAGPSWVRPAGMFFGQVWQGGHYVTRFTHSGNIAGDEGLRR